MIAWHEVLKFAAKRLYRIAQGRKLVCPGLFCVAASRQSAFSAE